MQKGALGCIALVFASVGLACSCGTAWLLPRTREAPLDMQDLMVDVSVFPQGWKLAYGPSHPPQGKRLKDEIEGVYAQFVGPDPDVTAIHEVRRYGNDLQAAVSFWTTGEFPRQDYVVTPWAAPEGWLYRSPNARRFRFACAELEILGRFFSCSTVAQYHEYISIFRTRVSPESMTLLDLEVILQAIDERMAHHIGTAEKSKD